MSKKPWYADGLQFECTQCGDCCTGAPGYVWVNKSEIEALAAEGQLTTAPWAAKGGDIGVFPSDLDGGEFESGMSERRQHELEAHLRISERWKIFK